MTGVIIIARLRALYIRACVCVFTIAHETGLAVLKEWLCNEKIPTINITSSVGNATVEYNFTKYVRSYGDMSRRASARQLIIRCSI